MLELLLPLVAAVVWVVSGLRWLRVAQREHYVAGEVTTAALRWARARRVNLGLGLVAIALAAAAVWEPWLAVVSMGIVAVWPVGLSLRGRTSRLVWTPRIWRLWISYVVLLVVVVAGVSWAASSAIALATCLVPCVLDLALVLTAPVERVFSSRFVNRAQAKLRAVGPQVVAITGSYGKTSTKAYVGHLLARRESVLVSPASFNNLLGLSRTINTQLTPGTTLFVAEMGTYGEGEIRQLCRVFPPDVSVIVTIGEAHLSRMKSRSAIVRAKSEIVEQSKVAVLNVDVPELDQLAEQLAKRQRVVRCSTDAARAEAEVLVVESDGRWSVTVEGSRVGDLAAPPFGHPINLACAVGVALALGVPIYADDLGGALPVAPHRAERHQGPGDVTIIDDTYNSNPVGAARAVEAAAMELPQGATLYVVTPGMVELGAEQARRNEELGRLVTRRSDCILAVVGWTNRRSLLRGASTGPGKVLAFGTREAATAGLAGRLRPGDTVLYENDLPDQYP